MVEQSELNEEWSLVDTPEAFAAAVERLAAGTGPLGVDAERASGFRYFNNAYLVQFSRRGSGTYLFDPVGIPDFSALQAALGEEEWVLHAASQDLPCLRDLGLDPVKIFDTELAARLLGYERVGLGAVIEHKLGIHLQKAHSAADWSIRPLPEEWLEYAALDVALLPELRDLIAQDLADSDKTEMARQEFQ
ncbi:ribonuclease D, partial [Leucobacter sp. M11]|uniref:ribonuclease D n=1 Tax=Leucobacter sp. M11 TaxID=2993565 RepID=UPI002D7FB050